MTKLAGTMPEDYINPGSYQACQVTRIERVTPAI